MAVFIGYNNGVPAGEVAELADAPDSKSLLSSGNYLYIQPFTGQHFSQMLKTVLGLGHGTAPEGTFQETRI
ncbi:MAG: hypothetical protein LAQ30_20245 [Acidobacteriia bacterium]|nr:hypothetical protein [Terriglobia bacterium]